MSHDTLTTVTGEIAPAALGKTLMHEHLVIGYPGWESDTPNPGPERDERVARCVDRIAELQDLGFSSLLDPCPNDLGRDVELTAKVAQQTGFQIICATGLYKQSEGGHPYWHMAGSFGDAASAMAELFIRELSEGIGSTGVRAGIIKVATGLGEMTDYERTIFEAAAKASAETGAPITTHTDQGTVGDLQQQVLTGAGAEANRIVIGHSCGTADTDYHMKIARGGSYLGFDRFGLDMLQPDDERVAALVRLVEGGAGDRIVVSHDSVWCWRGRPFPKEVQAQMEATWNPSHFSLRIVPKLKERGLSEEQINALLVDNPRRFFAGEKLPTLS
ncbi:MAG: phosphotriesterase-related protein [Myxococcota bacterium]|jgi:phosphotriesterase-related protein|nr:phosphotriesterase-related protein [Myxococcota bacterium]